MGRGPIYKDSAYSGPPGRDHWGTTQFVLVAGGGFKHGMVLGKTDARAQYVTHDWYSPVSFGRTIYHLLGIDADRELYTTGGRPVKIIMDDAPLFRHVYGATNPIADPARVFNLWSTEFTGMHREHSCFVLTCHPWVSGRASRVALIEDLVRFIRRQRGVWFATCDEVAEWHQSKGASRPGRSR